jgi:hypothetical protein
LILKKTFLINDLVWIVFASAACYGGLKLGFGSFQQPQAGFMPFLSGLLLGLLALADLSFGLAKGWMDEKKDSDIWANINWGKLLLTLALLFIYTALFSTLGFVITTVLLLFFFFRAMEPRPWWIVAVSAVTCTGVFYLAFKVGLGSQLPSGIFGF